MRDDLRLAAYAAVNGFTLHGYPVSKSPVFDATGIPHDGLAFKIGNVTVWDTSRGWRVARLIDGRYEPSTPDQFHNNLKAALDRALELVKEA